MNTRYNIACLLLGGFLIAHPAPAEEGLKSTPGRDWPSVVVSPALDVPMRDAAITRGPDGVYYLTGTLGTPSNKLNKSDSLDFDNSRQIKLWKSNDLKTWTEVGVVWDQDVQVFSGAAKYPQTAWMRQSHKDPASADSPVVHGLKSPELHHIKGDWYLCFSINDQGTGLLKSTSGKPEGPFEAHAQITLRHGDPSMFWDEKDAWGGSDKVYWLFGGGWIAEMNDDLTALVEQPRLLLSTYDKPPDWALAKGANIFRDHPLTVGDQGVFLFKNRGRYFLTAAERTNRLNASCDDTFIAWSDSLLGPYGPRELMVPHGGGVTVFRGPRTSAVPEFYFPQPAHFLTTRSQYALSPEEIEKARGDDPLYVSFFGNDERAIFRDRASFLPLEWTGPERWLASRFGDFQSFPRKPQHVITERGPWPWMKPLVDVCVRDLRVIAAPNGKYYFSGAILSEPGKLYLWESDDLAQWRRIGPVWTYEQVEWLPVKLPYGDADKVDFEHIIWHAWPNWLGDTFYITYCIFRPNDPAHAGHSGVGALRSTTGKPEGPYESLGRVGGQYGLSTEPNYFEFFRLDGKLWAGDWVNWQPVVAKIDESKLATREGWKFDWQRVDAGVFEWMFRGDTHGSTSIANRPFFYFMSGGELDGKEVGRANTYDHYYVEMQSPTGPPKIGARPQVVPHNGQANVFQDHKGRWWSSMFSNDHSAVWWEKFGLIALRVEDGADGFLRIDVEDKPDDEQKRIMGGGKIAEVRTVQETIGSKR
jgi:hypothetical protein